MYEQRAEKSTERFEPQGPWQPIGLPTVSGTLDQRVADGPWYVVVDELHGTWCRVVVDGWPDVDTDGRLVFDVEKTRLDLLDREAVHRVIREARASVADTPEDRESADRRLRIGDVFAVWPQGADALGIGDERASSAGPVPPDAPAAGIIDVTAAARVVTRAAIEAVGAGELTENDMDRLGIPEEAVEPRAAV